MFPAVHDHDLTQGKTQPNCTADANNDGVVANIQY